PAGRRKDAPSKEFLLSLRLRKTKNKISRRPITASKAMLLGFEILFFILTKGLGLPYGLFLTIIFEPLKFLLQYLWVHRSSRQAGSCLKFLEAKSDMQ
ncbi:hypothetical protein, partial [Flavivirga jejuensis]|uniref:hypothetical protein n=1 Tax=Flavivirga jejuensis TaxID=870487 RepID=UPI0031F00FF3